MIKKLAVLVVFLFVWINLTGLTPGTQAQEGIFYGAGQIGFGDVIGGGYTVRLGQEFSQYILWVEWEEFTNYNDGEEENANSGRLGFSVMSDKFIHMYTDWGIFFTVQGGFGNEEGEKVRFSKEATAGVFFEPSDITRIYLGGGVSGVKEMYPKIEAGFSLGVDFNR